MQEVYNYQDLAIVLKFTEAYEQIKQNILLHRKTEGRGVFNLCRTLSPFRETPESRIVVLDIELSLEALDREGKQDRIDLVLFHKETKELRFIEAKTWANPELRGGVDAPVVAQVARYRAQAEERNGDILTNYCQYSKVVNRCFGDVLPLPKAVDQVVDLLIFDYETRDEGAVRKLCQFFDEGLDEQLRFFCHRKGSTEDTGQNTLTRKWWPRSWVAIN